MKLSVPGIILTIIFLLMQPLGVSSQRHSVSELKTRLQLLKAKKDYLQDTAYANTLNQLAFIYADNYPDSAIVMLANHPEHCRAIKYTQGESDSYKILGNAYQVKGDFTKALMYYETAYKVAEKDHKKALAGILNNIGLNYLNQGNYTIALTKFYDALKQAETNGDQYVTARTLNNVAMIHFFQGKMDEAEADYMKMLKIAKSLSDTSTIVAAYNNIGEVNLERNDLVKAKENFSTAYDLAMIVKNAELQVASIKNLGYVYYKMDSLPTSIQYFKNAYDLAVKLGNTPASCKALIGMATSYYKSGTYEKALTAGLQAVKLAEQMGQAQLLRDANEIVASTYESMGNGLAALKHFKKYKIYSDSLRNSESERMAASLKAEFNFSKKELEFQRETAQQRWIIFSAFAGLFSLLVIVWVINRNSNRVKHANLALQQKNLAIEHQKAIVEDTLVQLKSTQKQLIQSEKMAGLGELTAGIAHEIQNPLNFVNNFSEVSVELVEELKVEKTKAQSERDEQLETELLNDISQNLEKITFHGKRADAIVKGMLQHSRASSGTKEPTNINALADEYLRLSYHGLRAKDKSFNADFKTDFDEGLKQVNVVPQDIGRVLLNLYNNAFYAASQPTEEEFKNPQPLVTVTTKSISLPSGAPGLLISVRDNGPGIPQQLLDKIFQPFFTTKPTGQGTGLGLSMSYDIIKAHGGDIKVNTGEGEGSEFVIELPLS